MTKSSYRYFEPDKIGRLLEPAVRDKVIEAGVRAGFRYVAADLRGYRSGSLNEALESPP